MYQGTAVSIALSRLRLGEKPRGLEILSRSCSQG